MVGSRFGRDAQRIQPAPKVCISKLAEQFPSEMTGGKLAVLAGYGIVVMAGEPITVVWMVAASVVNFNEKWEGASLSPEGIEMQAEVIRDPNTGVIASRVRAYVGIELVDEWVTYYPGKANKWPYSSDNVQSYGTITNNRLNSILRVA